MLTAQWNNALWNGTKYNQAPQTGFKQSPVIASLVYNGQVLPVNGNGPTLDYCNAFDPKTGQVVTPSPFGDWWLSVTQHDANSSTAVMSFPALNNSTISINYNVGTDELVMPVTYDNRSPYIWTQRCLTVLTPQLPNQSYVNTDSPSLPMFNVPGGVMVATLETGNYAWFGQISGNRMTCGDYLSPGYDDQSKPLRGTIRKWDAPYPVTSDSKPAYGDLVPDPSVVSGALMPGTSDGFTLSLRFAPAGSPIQTIAPDAIAAYRTANPSTLTWHDRRPIGAAWLADWGELNGLVGAAYRTAFLARIGQCIAGLKAVDGQGLVFWDADGPYAPNKYIGNPGAIQSLNPGLGWRSTPSDKTTLELALDAMRENDIGYGFTARAQQTTGGNVTELAGPDWNATYEPGEPLPPMIQMVVDKIQKVVEMGGRYVYLDSPVKLFQYDPKWFRGIRAMFPNVLIFAENSPDWAYSCSMPYVEIRANQFGPTHADVVKAVWPECGAVVWCSDPSATQSLTLSPMAIMKGKAAGSALLIKPTAPADVAAVAAMS